MYFALVSVPLTKIENPHSRLHPTTSTQKTSTSTNFSYYAEYQSLVTVALALVSILKSNWRYVTLVVVRQSSVLPQKSPEVPVWLSAIAKSASIAFQCMPAEFQYCQWYIQQNSRQYMQLTPVTSSQVNPNPKPPRLVCRIPAGGYTVSRLGG